MNIMKAQDETEAKVEAINLSNLNPGKYITVRPCFGLIASIKTRLHVFDPSDSAYGWYVLNGKVKAFTSRQKIADQNATPIMS